MALRLAFDLDGVLADMSAALARERRRLIERREISAPPPSRAESALDPDHDAGTAGDAVGAEAQRDRLTAAQQLVLWRRVTQTPNFWETLAEIEPGCLRMLAQLARKHRWEIIFLTKRPQTAGETSQLQTQRWLERHGFLFPSVFVVNGSRGRIADALALDMVVDDLPANCVDVMSDSKAKAILVWRGPSQTVPARAKRLGIRVVRSTSECVSVLHDIECRRTQRRTWKDRVESLLRPAALT